MAAIFLAAVAALAYKVPSGIGVPSQAPVESRPKTTLADAAAAGSQQTDIARQPSNVFNIDFVPRVGWRGTVFPSVASPVCFSIVCSAVTLVLHDEYGFNGINPTAHTVMGVLVSFLAVFRTQQAYSRYWEGRGHLGCIMASIVDIASTASVQLSGEQPQAAAAARRELARLLRLYFRETVGFLRATSRTTRSVSNYWLPEDFLSPTDAASSECDLDATPAECAALAAVPRSPVLVLQWLRAHLYRAGVEDKLLVGRDDAERLRALQLGLERQLATLQPSFNGAAKIATTPTPQPYTQMGRWLVFWFVFTLPLTLIGTFGSLGADGGDISIAFVPAGMLIAFGYYGLDYCATQLQNPFIAEFGDVTLDGRFVNAVCEDVDALLLSADPSGQSLRP